MTAIIIIGIVLGIVLFLFLGFWIWSLAMDKFYYNIFNLGVIIRGLISYVCFFLSAMSYKDDKDSSLIFIVVAGLLWLWTFLTTMFKTNIFIALFSVAYQVFAVFLVRKAIESLVD